jgi:hypothetical protein
MIANMASCQVSITFGMNGPAVTGIAACAAGVYALYDAFHMLKRGDAKALLTGGTESAISPLAFVSLGRLGALSKRNDEPTKASRPFDKDRDGFVFGEGAGVLVLETLDHARRRDAPILAELLELHASARPRILDCTYGRGRVWGHLPARRRVIKVDVNGQLPGLDLVADWLELPCHFARGSIDCLVWDPIHVADVGRTSAFYTRYVAPQHPVNGESVAHLYAGFLDVAEWLVRPTTGICLVKLCDQVHEGRQRWQVHQLVELAQRRGWTACDYTIVQNGAGRRCDPKHASRYHVRNQWAFWVVLRHGPACHRPGQRLKHQLVCQVCGESFWARRADATTCGRACRQAAYHQRQAIMAP